jgi:DNA polymerase IIIc chi subunit
VQAEELIEDLDAVKTEEDLQKIRDRFRKMRAEEATKRPIENSPS